MTASLSCTDEDNKIRPVAGRIAPAEPTMMMAAAKEGQCWRMVGYAALNPPYFVGIIG